MAARAGSARRKGAAAAALRAGTRAGRATQVGGEGRKVHTLARRPTCGAVSESQRGGARGTRAGRARARGRGRRAGSRSGPAGRSERRGARRWERFASGGAARLPPAAPDASPAAPSRSRAGAGADSLSPSESRRPRAARWLYPPRSLRVCGRARAATDLGAPPPPQPQGGLDARLPGPPGADRRGGGQAAGVESAGARDPPRGCRGPWACGFKEPQPLLESSGSSMGALLPGPSWDKLSGKSRLGRRDPSLRKGKTVSGFGSRWHVLLLRTAEDTWSPSKETRAHGTPLLQCRRRTYSPGARTALSPTKQAS